MSNHREPTEFKKKDKWIEAGNEFQVESYPCGSGHGKKNRKRGNIPLPSHTARRNNNSSAARGRSGRRQSTLTQAMTTMNHSTMGGGGMTIGTATNDMHVSATAGMPDLADLTIPDERKTYWEISKIKGMPLPFHQKVEMKSQVMAIPILRLSGCSLLKWKLICAFRYIKHFFMRRKRNCILWKRSLEAIVDERGTSVTEVFLFLKWTLFLNFATFLLIFTLLILPFYLQDFVQIDTATEPCHNNTSSMNSNFKDPSYGQNNSEFLNNLVACCSEKFQNSLTPSNYTLESSLTNRTTQIQIFMFNNELLFKKIHDGISLLKSSPIFYGFYQARNITFSGLDFSYDYPMSYLLVIFFIFAICFLLLMKSLIYGVKEIILAREGEVNRYSNLIFGGWEFSCNSAQGANYKRKMLRREMKSVLKSEKLDDEKIEWTSGERLKAYIIRIVVNLVVLCLFASFAYGLYYTTSIVQSITNPNEPHQNTDESSSEALNFAIGFLPFVAVIYSNLFLRIIVEKIGKLELYSLEMEIGWFLVRSVLFYAISLSAVFYKFSETAYCELKANTCNTCQMESNSTLISSNGDPEVKGRIDCWENFVAEQLYKLLLTDLIIRIFTTFVVDTFRILLGKLCPCKFFESIGAIEFNLLRHTLDIIYIQILSWLGMYFSPVFPLFAILYLLLIFYVKKFSLLFNSRGITKIFRATRTKAVLILTQLVSFSLTCSTIIVVIGYVNPSRECGPFRYNIIPWEALTKILNSIEYQYFLIIVNKIASPILFVPIIFILIFFLYYYYSVAQANRNINETLKNLLILEGHDKQYLFARLNTLRGKGNSLSERSTEATLNLNSDA